MQAAFRGPRLLELVFRVRSPVSEEENTLEALTVQAVAVAVRVRPARLLAGAQTDRLLPQQAYSDHKCTGNLLPVGARLACFTHSSPMRISSPSIAQGDNPCRSRPERS